MGADIHFYVEIQQDDGTWEKAPGVYEPCYACKGTGRANTLVCAHCGNPEEDHVEGRCLYHPSTLLLVPAPCRWSCENGQQLNNYFRDRDYDLFGFLAGVRGPPAPGFTDVRGLPRDVSLDLKEMYDSGFHSATWYSLRELREFFVNRRRRFEYFWRALQDIKKLHKDPHRIRAVMWFDS